MNSEVVRATNQQQATALASAPRVLDRIERTYGVFKHPYLEYYVKVVALKLIVVTAEFPSCIGT